MRIKCVGGGGSGVPSTVFQFFCIKSLIWSDLNTKNWFWGTFSPISVVLLDRLFPKTIGFTHEWTRINHVNFMKIDSKLRSVLCVLIHMWHSVGKGLIWSFLEAEILRKIGEMFKKLKEKSFPDFGMLGNQKRPYIGSKRKTSLQGSIQTQFYMAIKGPFGRFLLQLCTESVK